MQQELVEEVVLIENKNYRTTFVLQMVMNWCLNTTVQNENITHCLQDVLTD